MCKCVYLWSDKVFRVIILRHSELLILFTVALCICKSKNKLNCVYKVSKSRTISFICLYTDLLLDKESQDSAYLSQCLTTNT